MYEYENKIIGLFIGYYRKKRLKHDERFSRKDFVAYKSNDLKDMCQTCKKTCAKKEAICAAKTSLWIEKGEVIKNVCFYIDFCAKLDREYVLNKRMLEMIAYSEKKLVSLIRNNSQTGLEDFKLFLETSYQKYKNVMYFSEMLQLYLVIVKMLLDYEFPDYHLVEIYEEFYSAFNSTTKYFISYMLMHYYETYDYQMDKQLFYEGELGNQGIYNVEYVLRKRKKKSSLLDFYHYLTDIDTSELLPYERYLVQIFLSGTSYQLKHYRLALKAIEQCLNDLSVPEESMTQHALYYAYAKKANILYRLERYNEALALYKQVYMYDPDLLALDFMLFIHCFEICEQNKSVQRYLKSENLHRLKIPSVKRIYRYYQQKFYYHASFKELEAFILDELRYFIPIETVYYDIMRSDMMEYCTATKDYKSFFLFQKQPKPKK